MFGLVCGSERDEPAARGARVPFAAPGFVLGVVGEALVRAVGVPAHAVERQWLDLERRELAALRELKSALAAELATRLGE